MGTVVAGWVACVGGVIGAVVDGAVVAGTVGVTPGAEDVLLGRVAGAELPVLDMITLLLGCVPGVDVAIVPIVASPGWVVGATCTCTVAVQPAIRVITNSQLKILLNNLFLFIFPLSQSRFISL